MREEGVDAHEQAIIDALFAWWPSVRSARDALPWRSVRDPWLTLMAELMLGQTQVARVAPRFVAMAERFPTPRSCATAAQREVLALWVGLGYNRRAVALHRCALMICEEYGGEVPRDLAALQRLPGVGPYTSRAVLAFAFGEQVGVVDTNIGRVLARAFTGMSLHPRDAQELADRLVPSHRARDWNLAIMDFGNLVCRSRQPRCECCPLAQRHCRWKTTVGEGETANDPAIGSGGVSVRQPTFEGSDRQGRGRIVRAALHGTLEERGLIEVTGWHDDPQRAHRIALELVNEGVLLRNRSGNYQIA